MVRQSLGRRRFGAALAAAAVTVSLAGCSDDDSADDDSAQFEPDDPGDLTLTLENEDGEPVSSGVGVTIEHQDEDYTSNYRENIEDGQLTAGLMYEGDYTVTVESDDDEFENVEESVTLAENEDESMTIVLDGATPDSDEDDE